MRTLFLGMNLLLNLLITEITVSLTQWWLVWLLASLGRMLLPLVVLATEIRRFGHRCLHNRHHSLFILVHMD